MEDMKLLEYFKALIYLIILLVAFAVLKMLQTIGEDTNQDKLEIVWEEDFDSAQLRTPYWVANPSDRILPIDGNCRLDTSTFTMMLNLFMIKKEFTSTLDSGFLEIKVKLPLNHEVEIYHVDLLRDTTRVPIPKGLHSEYIKLKSENFSYERMGNLIIQGSPSEKKFDIVDTAFKLIEDESMLLDYVRLYGIKD